MKPVPDTLETRRLATIERAHRTLAGDRREYDEGVIRRMQAVIDLGPDATAQQIIDAQKAADGWTNMYLTTTCAACGEQVENAVRVCEEPDYESSTATLCRGCLVEALAALDGATDLQPAPEVPRAD